MLRRWLVGGLSVALLASVLLAKPGVVTNRQGETFKGDVTEDDKFVYINGPGGQIKLDKRNIASITYAEAVDDEYKARHAKLADNDVNGRIALAQWANDNDRADLAVAVLTEARKIDPFNKDAARLLDAAQQQLDMDQAAAHARATTGSTTAPSTGAATTAPTTQAVTEAALPRRPLTPDEINLIRQKEMQPDDPKVRIRFDNGVVKKYLAGGDHDPKAFNSLTPEAQAIEILSQGDPKFARDVRVLTDPTPLLEFRQKLNPIIANGCGSTACHGGTKAGDFALYSGDSTAAVYTNFFILFKYSTTIGGVKYLALDREVPERSLVLQFGLPHADAQPPHPKVPNLKVRFKSSNDPGYQEIYNWMTKSLSVMQPDYGIKVGVRLEAPVPRPAATAPVAPAPN